MSAFDAIGREPNEHRLTGEAGDRVVVQIDGEVVARLVPERATLYRRGLPCQGGALPRFLPEPAFCRLPMGHLAGWPPGPAGEGKIAHSDGDVASATVREPRCAPSAWETGDSRA